MSVLKANSEELGGVRAYEREGKRFGILSECQSDYILPDYMGDVKRLLRYSACVVPCNKFVAGSEVSALETVNFRITYLDAENIITEAQFSSDVEHTERLPEKACDACVNTAVHGVTVRLGGPRKISARASLVTDISFTEQREMPLADLAEGAHEKRAQMKIHTADYLKCGEREYAEQIEKFEDMLPDEVDVIKYDARAFIDSVHKTDSGVNLSGDLIAWCILKVDDDVMRIEKTIPVEENLEIEGACESSVYIPHIYVTDTNINMNSTPADRDGGSFLSVVMNMTVECEVEHHKNEEYSTVTDAFYENAETVCEYGDFSYNELTSASSERRKVSFTAERGEENLHDIVERDALLKNIKYEMLAGEVKISADLTVTLVCRGADSGDFFPVKLERQIEERIKLPGASESGIVRVSAEPCELSAAFDSDKIYVDVTVALGAVCETPRKVKLLSSIDKKQREEPSGRRIIVYYTEKGDTLWSVAKKYGVSPERIASKNMVSVKDGAECDISGTKKIIIA